MTQSEKHYTVAKETLTNVCRFYWTALRVTTPSNGYHNGSRYPWGLRVIPMYICYNLGNLQEEMCAVQPPDCEKLKAFITAR